MASFVEQATLIVKDQATSQINKINAALKQLNATAKSIKGMKIDFGNLNKASGDVRRLTAELRSLQSVARNIRLSVNIGPLMAAFASIELLRSQHRKATRGRFRTS
jgi:spore germination protein YaaH